MFVACGIWCLADVSSVSPSSEQTNRPELDENIPILLANPNRDSISVGTQEQLSQANN